MAGNTWVFDGKIPARPCWVCGEAVPSMEIDFARPFLVVESAHERCVWLPEADDGAWAS